MSNFPGNPDSTHAVNFEYKFPDASKPCIVTLILSKTSGKYRLQSNHLHAIWPVLQDLMQRFLIEAKARGLELNVTFDENAPIHDLFTLFTDNVKVLYWEHVQPNLFNMTCSLTLRRTAQNTRNYRNNWRVWPNYFVMYKHDWLFGIMTRFPLPLTVLIVYWKRCAMKYVSSFLLTVHSGTNKST